MLRIVAELPADRNRCGYLVVAGSDGGVVKGPYRISGRSSDLLAVTSRNAMRNPLLPYGDTPSGSYRVRRIVPSGIGTHLDAGQFGSNGVLLIEATDGEAALAEANGRFRLFVQGGSLGPDGELRSTAGALRLADADMAQLVALVAQHPDLRLDVVVHDLARDGGAVWDDPNCSDEDPPSLSGPGALANELARDLSRRAALKAGALGAGVSALTLSVSFISLAAPNSAHAGSVEMAYNSPPEHQVAPGPVNPSPSPGPGPEPGPVSGGGTGTLTLYNQTSANLSFSSTVSLCINSGNVIRNGMCTSTQDAGSYTVTATRLDNNKTASKTIEVPAHGEGNWSVVDDDFKD